MYILGIYIYIYVYTYSVYIYIYICIHTHVCHMFGIFWYVFAIDYWTYWLCKLMAAEEQVRTLEEEATSSINIGYCKIFVLNRNLQRALYCSVYCPSLG